MHSRFREVVLRNAEVCEVAFEMVATSAEFTVVRRCLKVLPLLRILGH